MSTTQLKFNHQNRPDFVSTLRKRVKQHFKDNNISVYANLSMKLKTAFMLSLYFSPLVIMLSGLIHSTLTTFMLYTVMGFGMAGIGLCVMHDANHRSYSKKKIVNKVLGFTANFIGAYHINWIIQHNVLHHSYTNIHDHDEDIDKKGIIRFSPHQDHKWFYKYQAYYAPFLYGIMTIYWLFVKDFDQLYRYNKEGLLKTQGLTFTKSLITLVFHKVWYIALTVVAPIFMLGIAWWQVVLAFLLMQFISGLILALVFQPAHVIEKTHFFKPHESGTMENNWAIHQLNTTSNFANQSKWFSWLVGGLNFQIEHHLFPNICHIHYQDINKIVEKTALEFGLPYYHNKSFSTALVSHFSFLNKLGQAEYKHKSNFLA